VFDERAADYGIIGGIPLFHGGKGWNTLKVAQLEHTATVWETERSRDLMVFAVTEAFYRIVGLDSLIAATQFSRRSLEVHYKQVEERIAVGKAARVDALRIKVRMADLDQTLAKLEDDREITVRLLVYRMGQEGRSEGELQVAAALEDPDVPWSLDGALKQAVSNRADYRAVQRRVEAQQKRWSMAKAGRWPEVILKGYYGGRSGGDLAFDDDWNVGVQLDMPLFVGGTIAARVREEKCKLRQMEEAERKFRLAIELEVRTAYLHLQQAQRWMQTAGAVVEQAREVLRIAEERHRLGKGTVAEVLDAQAEALKAQAHVVQAFVDRALAIAELEKATGITLPTRMKD
jgi:outer membrane protein TolC